ncbi:MAG: cupin domain-containing protein [Peptococcia bacterium]
MYYGYLPFYPYYNNLLMYNPHLYPMPNWGQPPSNYPYNWNPYLELRDYGPEPYVVNIERATLQNNTFRTALWTGKYLQLTLMSINVGEDIGLEMHPDVDQFIRIEQGQGIVLMGDCKDRVNFKQMVSDDFAIFIPAGKWHNVINTGNTPLKLYSIYAPPEHPHGTVHKTKQDAEHHH